MGMGYFSGSSMMKHSVERLRCGVCVGDPVWSLAVVAPGARIADSAAPCKNTYRCVMVILESVTKSG